MQQRSIELLQYALLYISHAAHLKQNPIPNMTNRLHRSGHLRIPDVIWQVSPTIFQPYTPCLGPNHHGSDDIPGPEDNSQAPTKKPDSAGRTVPI